MKTQTLTIRTENDQFLLVTTQFENGEFVRSDDHDDRFETIEAACEAMNLNADSSEMIIVSRTQDEIILRFAEVESDDEKDEAETLNEILEDGMYDVQPLRELETSVEFDDWAVNGFGYVLWNDEIFAKYQHDESPDFVIYHRVGDGWAQY